MIQKKIQFNSKQLGMVTKSSVLLTSVLGTAILSSGTVAIANTTGNIESIDNHQAINQQLAAQPLPNTPSPINNQLAQVQLNDINGNWAEPFIRALANKGIIFGYPDGTFRPNQPVTRAEFAALLNRAFDLQPIRSRVNFRDVPTRFWATEVVNKAYESGFMAGYPNGTFGPNQNIIRIQALVAMVNGTKLTPDSAKNVADPYRDTDQVPSYGKEALTTATSRCVSVSQEYPTSKTFNPNQVATRADVAALFHQVLVAAGRLPALDPNNPAQKYIATCDVAKPPEPPERPQATVNQLQSQFSVPGDLASVETIGGGYTGFGGPVGGVVTPSAFGANWGDVYLAAGYQNKNFLPNTGVTDFVNGGIGIGLGNARDFVGLEANYSGTQGSNNDLRSSASFKLHKLLSDTTAIAVGWDDAIRSGYNDANDPKDTIYGVVSQVIPLGGTTNITASVGAGNGKFRTFGDIQNRQDNFNVFGSLGLRLNESIGVVGDYNGRNFNVGLPITLRLGDNTGFQITPALLDIAGDQNSGPESRFGLGAGFGFKF